MDLGNVEPLTRTAMEKRDYTKRAVSKWADKGLISGEQHEAMHEDLSGHEVSGCPVLDMNESWVLERWVSMGSPCTVFSGMSVAIQDNRPMLYPMRLLWLTENDYTDRDVRSGLLYLWGQLDEEKLSCEVERVKKSLTEH